MQTFMGIDELVELIEGEAFETVYVLTQFGSSTYGILTDCDAAIDLLVDVQSDLGDDDVCLIGVSYDADLSEIEISPPKL